MSEPTTFASGGLRLEARLTPTPDAVGAAVICHPHPLYGGSMDNNVVNALEAALQAAEWATLAFNFRGVGASQGGYDQGRGETDDARAALAFLRAQTGAPRLLLAGYSFGAAIAVQVGAREPAIERLIAVAPPLAMMPSDLAPPDARPLLVVSGDRDPYCPLDQCERFVARWPGARLQRLAGADHFLHGFEPALHAAVVELAGEGAP